MIETAEAPVQEIAVVEKNALDEILPVVQQLSAHDKLILIRILADELANASASLPSIPPGVYESYTPYDIEADGHAMIAKLESAAPPTQFANAS